MQELATASSALSHEGIEPLNRLTSQYCNEVHSSRLRNALSSSLLDWELYITALERDRIEQQAWLIGNCLVVEGRVAALRHEFSEAANWYFEALSFGCDLAQRELTSSLVGMAISRAALLALTELLPASHHDDQQLAEMSSTLEKYKENLPTIRPSIRLAMLQAADNLEAEAELPLQRQQGTLWTYLLPRSAVAAWNLHRNERVLQLMMNLSESTQPNQYEGGAAALDRIASSIIDPGVREAVPINCQGAVQSERYLENFFHAVLAAVALWRWQASQGRFPIDDGPIKRALTHDGLRYSVIENGAGFRIDVSSGAGLVVLLEQRSKAMDKKLLPKP